MEKARREVNVRVDGPLVFNDVPLAVDAAVEGFGLACVFEPLVETHLRAGRLVRVLDDGCAPFAGYQLYYPSRRQLSPAFMLVLDALRAQRGVAR